VEPAATLPDAAPGLGTDDLNLPGSRPDRKNSNTFNGTSFVPFLNNVPRNVLREDFGSLLEAVECLFVRCGDRECNDKV
jgi:hypothetical protein